MISSLDLRNYEYIRARQKAELERKRDEERKYYNDAIDAAQIPVPGESYLSQGTVEWCERPNEDLLRKNKKLLLVIGKNK